MTVTSKSEDAADTRRITDEDPTALAAAVERHEAEVWSACFEAAASLPGDPLGVVRGGPGWPPLATLGRVDSYEINRVVGLGVVDPASPDDVGRIVDFFHHHGQTRFRIELSPQGRPTELRSWMEAAGFELGPESTTKMVRQTDDVDPPGAETEVRTLGPEHRAAIGRLNALAWGAGADEASVQWFGATVGASGFHHYGIFDGERLVSTGALFATPPMGWVGFAATHPRYRERGFRQAVNAVRLAEARRLGCRTVHVEIDSRYSSSLRLPFQRLYDRPFYLSRV